MEKLFNCDEVAEIFGIKKITVYDWVRKGKLPAVRVGKAYRVAESDIERYIEAHKIGATHE